jgi:hypothetical protein
MCRIIIGVANLWHAGHEMTDRHPGGHGHGRLGGHADRDLRKRIHVVLVHGPIMNPRRLWRRE